MRFKIDENLPVEVAELLRAAGHDADTVHDEGLAGAPDARISAIVRDERRVLVTLDFDFADIRAYPPSEYGGIVVLWLRTHERDAVIRLMARALEVLIHEPISGKLWIVEEARIRVRE